MTGVAPVSLICSGIVGAGARVMTSSPGLNNTSAMLTALLAAGRVRTSAGVIEICSPCGHRAHTASRSSSMPAAAQAGWLPRWRRCRPSSRVQAYQSAAGPEVHHPPLRDGPIGFAATFSGRRGNSSNVQRAWVLPDLARTKFHHRRDESCLLAEFKTLISLELRYVFAPPAREHCLSAGRGDDYQRHLKFVLKSETARKPLTMALARLFRA